MTAAAEETEARGPETTCRLLVVGCGNLLRSDDGVGPILVRHLWERGVPDEVRLVDGGTAGMDVAFQMQGAERVILVDACTSGHDPGTVFKLPGPEVEDLPPLSGLHTHMFRWDNALAFARWLLGDGYPTDITVYLVEAGSFEPGGALSPEVRAGMEKVLALIEKEPPFAERPDVVVEFTTDGYLRIDADTAHQYFPGDTTAAAVRDGELVLVPLHSTASGGMLLKQRNAAGDRAVLVREVLHDLLPVGTRAARWDAGQGALRVTLAQPGAAQGRDG